MKVEHGFLQAIGRARAAKGGQGASVDGLPAFLAAKNIKPFISSDLVESTRPIHYVGTMIRPPFLLSAEIQS